MKDGVWEFSSDSGFVSKDERFLVKGWVGLWLVYEYTGSHKCNATCFLIIVDLVLTLRMMLLFVCGRIVKSRLECSYVGFVWMGTP
jgi:hypothetical protein